MTSPEQWLAARRTALRSLRRDIGALHLAYRDPRTPWYAKAVALAVFAYAVSPLDLIPDFIPVLGYLDDLLLLPLGVWLALRLIPPHVMADARAALDARPARSAAGWVAAAMIAGIWLGLALWLWGLAFARRLPA